LRGRARRARVATSRRRSIASCVHEIWWTPSRSGSTSKRPKERSDQVHVELDLEEWRRRRAHDGFGFIVAHPDETRTAVELCQLYRAKDAVEKDFQVIKSLIRVRPIWHRTDPKVRAHVTICMLALLLERTLNERLANVSAAQAIQVLSTCCLNRFAGTRRADYVVTQPDDAQQALLRELELGQLAEDDYIVERLQPR
jgi:hypothetical protein